MNRIGYVVAIALILAGCMGTRTDENVYSTPTVDYVEQLDVYNAPHKDSFLNQLAMNYRSYAVYNARTSGYPDVGELFAQKAVGAFSGERPFPESLDNWRVYSEIEGFEINNAYVKLMEYLKGDAVVLQPQLAAEAQAKFDCWISATATGQDATAQECKKRFSATIQALEDCLAGRGVSAPVAQAQQTTQEKATVQSAPRVAERYYPETSNLMAMSGTTRSRDGMVIVNNVNIPANLVQVVPVPAAPVQQTVAVPQQQPLIFNQNIYGVDPNARKSDDEWEEIIIQDDDPRPEIPREFTVKHEMPELPKEVTVKHEMPELPEFPGTVAAPEDTPDYVSRDEFIEMMMAMRSELLLINKRLDNIGNATVTNNNEKTIIKVQQIPLEPKQHIMEEIFEIRFDFDKATITPEYEDLIKKLATTTQANKNIKVSVVGHTDTAGSSDYNYALGGRRAEAVQKMLIQYGIPSSQIIAVSAGEEDLKVPTPNNTPNAENRRVRVVKEIHYTEPAKPASLVLEEYTTSAADDECEDCDDSQETEDYYEVEEDNL